LIRSCWFGITWAASWRSWVVIWRKKRTGWGASVGNWRMIGTLSAMPDGVSCGASMVKNESWHSRRSRCLSTDLFGLNAQASI